MRCRFSSLLVLATLLGGSAPQCPAVFNVFTNRAEFAAASGATNATGPIPNWGWVTTNPVVGAVTFSRGTGTTRLYVGSGTALDYSARLAGNELAITGPENLAATFRTPVRAAGFEIVEPEFDPNLDAPFIDSVFSVVLKNGSATVGVFQFSPPNDAAAFCGVTSDRAFDRMEITEVVGGEESEFFGQFLAAEAVQFPSLPVAGKEIGELAPVDAAMRDYLEAAQYPGMQLAIMRNGELMFSRGYGWTDHSRLTPLPKEQPMTLASVSKVLTDALVTRLIAQGRLSGTNRIVELLGLPPIVGGAFSAGATEITVDHLLGHGSGLSEYRPDNNAVGTSLGLGRPASFAETISWGLCQPLLFAPGTASQYSNFGYAILGVVIEKVTGLSYGDCLREELGSPLEMRSLRVPPELQITNPAPATTLLAETYANNAAAGGVQSSAEDLCRFMRAYRLSGVLKPRPVPSGGFFFSFYGSSDGALSVVNQRISGGTALEFAVICNERGYQNNDYLKNLVFSVIDPVTNWPSLNLFPYFTWRMDQFWSPTVGTMAVGSWAEEDFDQDGVSNFAEYVFDLNPKSSASKVLSQPAWTAGPSWLDYATTRNARKVDVVYEMQSSTNLVDWLPIARSSDGESPVSLEAAASVSETGSGFQRTNIVRWPTSDGARQRFFRQRISPE